MALPHTCFSRSGELAMVDRNCWKSNSHNIHGITLIGALAENPGGRQSIELMMVVVVFDDPVKNPRSFPNAGIHPLDQARSHVTSP
jgi:hypothetical protein